MEKGDKTLDNILLILASLFFHKKPIKGRTRFQKTIFLLKKKYRIPFDLNFIPYYYGPYSEELADLTSLLRALKLVEETTEYLGIGMIRYNYQLTEKGKKYFKRFQKNVGRETRGSIKELGKSVLEVSMLPTPDLISISKSLLKK